MTSKIACWPAGPTEISCHFAIRHQIFVEEQGVMVFTDVDRWDCDLQTVHVVAARGDQMAGTVRLYELPEAGRWKGDRLAVLPAHRSSMVGVRLVRHAVETAARAGGSEMEASVQVANTRFFQRIGWVCDGPVSSYFGLPHQPMVIDLQASVANKQLGLADERPRYPELRLPVELFEHSPILVSS